MSGLWTTAAAALRPRGMLAPMAQLLESNPCPRCGSTDVIPILYGTAGRTAALAQNSGVELAGRVWDADAPSSRCRACRHTWSRSSGA